MLVRLTNRPLWWRRKRSLLLLLIIIALGLGVVIIGIRLRIRILSLVVVCILVGLGIVVVVIVATVALGSWIRCINGPIIRPLISIHRTPFTDLNGPTSTTSTTADIIGDRVYIIRVLIISESHPTSCILANATCRLHWEETNRLASSSAHEESNNAKKERERDSL